MVAKGIALRTNNDIDKIEHYLEQTQSMTMSHFDDIRHEMLSTELAKRLAVLKTQKEEYKKAEAEVLARAREYLDKLNASAAIALLERETSVHADMVECRIQLIDLYLQQGHKEAAVRACASLAAEYPHTYLKSDFAIQDTIREIVFSDPNNASNISHDKRLAFCELGRDFDILQSKTHDKQLSSWIANSKLTSKSLTNEHIVTDASSFPSIIDYLNHTLSISKSIDLPEINS